MIHNANRMKIRIAEFEANGMFVPDLCRPDALAHARVGMRKLRILRSKRNFPQKREKKV